MKTTWFMMENFLPSLLSGSLNAFLLMPSSDSDLNTFSLSHFSSPSDSSLSFRFFLRFRRSLALLELSLEISEELRDILPPPSSSTASSETVPAEVTIAAAWGCRQEKGKINQILPCSCFRKECGLMHVGTSLWGRIEMLILSLGRNLQPGLVKIFIVYFCR